jgi:hypothetical protein
MRYTFGPLLAATLGTACLPTDTRPPPAEVEVTASSSEATRAGVVTLDGYAITFERVLVDVGQPQVGDDEDQSGPCSEYSNPEYTRLFDFVKVEHPERVGLAFALGHCNFEFAVRFPNPDALIATGASAADAELMRTPGSDPYADDAGVSVYVIGSATSADVSKRFAWAFRERIGYRDCWVPRGDAKDYGVVLAEDGSVVVNLEMQAEALFRDQLDPERAMLRFQPFADADVDGDGEVTLDELDGVKLADLAPLYDYPFDPDASPDQTPVYCGDSDGNSVTVRTLGDYAYCALAPSIARYQGSGACRINTGRRRRD